MGKGKRVRQERKDGKRKVQSVWHDVPVGVYMHGRKHRMPINKKRDRNTVYLKERGLI